MRKIYSGTLFLAVLFAFTSISINAQDTLRPRYGLFGGVMINIHNLDFRALPGVPSCCPHYQSGFGIGPTLGFSYEYPVNDKWLVGAEAGYYGLNGKLSVDESEIVVVNLKEVPGIFTHTIDATLGFAGLKPFVEYRAMDNLFVRFGAGFAAPIINSFDQKEEITQPSKTGKFKDTDSRLRNVNSGNIKNMAPVIFSADAAVGYQFQLNAKKTLFLYPEIKLSYSFNDLVKDPTLKDLKWKVFSPAISLGVKYSPFETIHINIEKINIDTVEIQTPLVAKNEMRIGFPLIATSTEKDADTVFHITKVDRVDTLYYPEPPKIEPPKPQLIASFKTFSKDESGKISELDHLDADVQFVTEVYPLLPYVFFEKNSADIPKRYNLLSMKEEIKEQDIMPSPIIYHRENLNIIAQRLLNNPQTEINIIGYADQATETDNCNLAKRRAEAVKDYIVKVFRINADRIKVAVSTGNCAPKTPTMTQIEAAYAENRRVEIESKTYSITAPVYRKKYLRTQGIRQKEITFDLSASNNGVATGWNFSVDQAKNLLYTNEGKELPGSVNLPLKGEKASLIMPDRPIKAELKVNDVAGNSVVAKKNIEIVKDTNALETARLTLTLFKVSQYSLSDLMKNEIKTFVKAMNDGAEINVTGFSDYIGDPEQNKSLSLTRAQEVANFIKSVNPKAIVKSVAGDGSDKFAPGIWTYDTPEERFMSRTVEIEVSNKVK